jgi:mRNA-degrading endonuclease toxin of MazEF toxin-antitoxin module
MPISPTTIINQGDIYFCEPDPKDSVGSEQEGNRPWVILSVPQLHRGNCVVGVPLSRHTEKAGAHLIKVPWQEITVEGNDPNIDRVALTDQIRSLDKSRFRRKFGQISSRALTSIFDLGIDYLFGRPVLPKTISN